MKYSMQSYRALYNRIFAMWRVLSNLNKPTEGETAAMKSLEAQLAEYERKVKVLGWTNDSFLKLVG